MALIISGFNQVIIRGHLDEISSRLYKQKYFAESRRQKTPAEVEAEDREKEELLLANINQPALFDLFESYTSSLEKKWYRKNWLEFFTNFYFQDVLCILTASPYITFITEFLKFKFPFLSDLIGFNINVVYCKDDWEKIARGLEKIDSISKILNCFSYDERKSIILLDYRPRLFENIEKKRKEIKEKEIWGGIHTVKVALKDPNGEHISQLIDLCRGSASIQNNINPWSNSFRHYKLGFVKSAINSAWCSRPNSPSPSPQSSPRLPSPPPSEARPPSPETSSLPSFLPQASSRPSSPPPSEARPPSPPPFAYRSSPPRPPAYRPPSPVSPAPVRASSESSGQRLTEEEKTIYLPLKKYTYTDSANKIFTFFKRTDSNGRDMEMVDIAYLTNPFLLSVTYPIFLKGPQNAFPFFQWGARCLYFEPGSTILRDSPPYAQQPQPSSSTQEIKTAFNTLGISIGPSMKDFKVKDIYVAFRKLALKAHKREDSQFQIQILSNAKDIALAHAEKLGKQYDEI